MTSSWENAVSNKYDDTQNDNREVADGVKRLIDIMAPGGGFILATVHNVRPEVPPENLIAFFDTALEYDP